MRSSSAAVVFAAPDGDERWTRIADLLFANTKSGINRWHRFVSTGDHPIVVGKADAIVDMH